jgi:hypothetical protein
VASFVANNLPTKITDKPFNAIQPFDFRRRQAITPFFYTPVSAGDWQFARTRTRDFNLTQLGFGAPGYYRPKHLFFDTQLVSGTQVLGDSITQILLCLFLGLPL